MPELPEVEESRRAVEEHCAGRRIVSVKAADDNKVIEGCSPKEMEDALMGRVLVAARRKGKHMWFEFDQRPWLLLHFGMTGAVLIQGIDVVRYRSFKSAEGDEWPPRFHKLLLELEGGIKLAFVDGRRFARLRLQQNPMEEPPIGGLGPDALLELPTLDAFSAELRKRKAPLKAVLLDQAFLSGIGNWVADEVLYHSCIHPEQPAGSLSDDDCSRLHSSLQSVLKLAVSLGADSSRFPEDWMFHVRWGKKAGTLNGHKIEFSKVGGRTSAYVPHCQKLVKVASEVQHVKVEGKSSRKKEMTSVKVTKVIEERKQGDQLVAESKALAVDTKRRSSRLKKIETSDSTNANIDIKVELSEAIDDMKPNASSSRKTASTKMTNSSGAAVKQRASKKRPLKTPPEIVGQSEKSTIGKPKRRLKKS